MSRLSEFLRNKEPLKLAIMSYEHFDIDIVIMSDAYYEMYYKEMSPQKSDKDDFYQWLDQYIYTPKISEMLVILYLKGGLTIWDLNKKLGREEQQYPATYKAVMKLTRLGILKTESVLASARKEKKVTVNTEVVMLYGDDEFRKMMLDSWNTDAKKYIQEKMKWLVMEKEKVRG